MLTINALSYGTEVATMAQAGATGTVLAVLRNAIYLESDEGHIVGITGRDAPDGPLTLRVPSLEPILQAIGDGKGTTFRADARALVVGNDIRIELTPARSWHPPLLQRTGTSEARWQAAVALADLLSIHESGEGCASVATYLVRNSLVEMPDLSTNPLARRAASCLREFQAAWRANRQAESAATLSNLLGLGPGLTPSGDDIVSGILAALVWRGSLGEAPGESIRDLTTTLLEAASWRTNRISARLLYHAAEGVLYAPAMALGTALLAGDVSSTEEPTRRLLKIGSATGTDLAIGLQFGMLFDIKRET